MTEGSIEMRVWETMQLKKALFSGLFDSTADEVSFEKLGRSTFLKVVKEIVDDTSGSADADEPDRSAEDLGSDPGGHELPGVPDQPTGAETRSESTPKPPADGSGRQPDRPPDRPTAAPGIEEAVAGVLEAGVKFLEALVPPPAQPAGQAAQRVPQASPPTGQAVLSRLVRTDPQTNRPVMAVPLPENMDAARIGQALDGLARMFSGGA